MSNLSLDSVVRSDTQRIALGVQYCGQGFEGWQTQPHGNTVQDVLSRAISKIADESPTLYCAGRTDTGVHARWQVVHFNVQCTRPLDAWVKGVNTFLPDTVSVKGAQVVSDEFHARFSANARTYRYYFYSARSIDPFKPFMTWVHYPIDIAAIREAALVLLGTHDFSAFRAAQCQAKSPIKQLEQFDLVQENDYFFFEIKANAFLHHMVRNLVGTLMEVGLGRKPVKWVGQVLESRDRTQAAKTWPARGLTLWHVNYPEIFKIDRLFNNALAEV